MDEWINDLIDATLASPIGCAVWAVITLTSVTACCWFLAIAITA